MIDLYHPDAEWTVYTLHELCEREHFTEMFVVACVEHGVMDVPGRAPTDWRFSAEAILRLEKAFRLHRDLDIQLADLGLVLELLDERDALRREVLGLRRRLAHWEGI